MALNELSNESGLILFELYGSKTGLFEDNFFWVGQYESSPRQTFLLEEELIQS